MNAVFASVGLEPQHIALLISAANFLLTWAVALYMYLVNKNKVTNERIGRMEDDFDGKLAAHADRLARLESRAEQAPTHEDLADLYEKVNRVDAGVAALGGQFDGVRRLLATIHEHLLRGGH